MVYDTGKKEKARHEYKFPVDEKNIAVLDARIGRLMRKDPHVSEKGFYQIRSVYFDDIYNTCYQKNAAGVDPRAKYRIRIYDGSDKIIKLEKKVKQNGRTRKYAATLTKEQAQRLLSGELLFADEHSAKELAASPPLMQQFYMLQRTRRLRPKVIVIYDRIPYVEKNGNVRVTFDRNIAASTDFAHFFAPDIRKIPVMRPGEHLMEVKYDTFLPRVLREALEIGRLRQETFSKFYLCRKYMLEHSGF